MEGPEPGFVSRRAILFGPMKSHARRALRDIIQQSQDARRSSNNGETASVGSEAVIDLGAVRSSQRSGRSVAALRPRKALLIDAGISVSDAARKMASANADAALVRTSSSSRAAVGIVTDTDVCRKVVALGRDADATAVEAVMTRNPQTVLWNATASSALCTMVDNCFRHLPVLDEAGSVAGVQLFSFFTHVFLFLVGWLGGRRARRGKVPLGGAGGAARAPAGPCGQPSLTPRRFGRGRRAGGGGLRDGGGGLRHRDGVGAAGGERDGGEARRCPRARRGRRVRRHPYPQGPALPRHRRRARPARHEGRRRHDAGPAHPPRLGLGARRALAAGGLRLSQRARRAAVGRARRRARHPRTHPRGAAPDARHRKRAVGDRVGDQRVGDQRRWPRLANQRRSLGRRRRARCRRDGAGPAPGLGGGGEPPQRGDAAVRAPRSSRAGGDCSRAGGEQPRRRDAAAPGAAPPHIARRAGVQRRERGDHKRSRLRLHAPAPLRSGTGGLRAVGMPPNADGLSARRAVRCPCGAEGEGPYLVHRAVSPRMTVQRECRLLLHAPDDSPPQLFHFQALSHASLTPLNVPQYFCQQIS
mmetsp:Transcript_39188/g.123527  ORF Transcript_39188/g.123527 Transcript_39188/m.123527 type:complete len:587 (-) Transcript_39188:76-1836(-)